MFDRIVGNYDRLNAILSLGLDRGWRRAAIRTLAPIPGGRYLDLGCGTGDLALELVRVAATAHVIGIDPARRMLAAAIRKITVEKAAHVESSNAAGIHFAAGDALALPIAADCLDGVVTGFCLRNLPDRKQALAEMARTARPGGRLVILELTTPRGAVLSLCHRLYGRLVVAGLGRLFSSGDAYRYLVESIVRFPPHEEIVREMECAGWTGIRIRPLTGGIVTLFSGERA
jgi:demethylmenaquinone methyltransferase/2-methoxy-6-polyprenyl-1,4-benzoquinol methylase